MICENPYCQKEATEQMYFNLKKEVIDSTEISKSKPYWKVCEEHSGLTLHEVIYITAQFQLVAGYANSPRQEDANIEYSGLMTEKL